ncbi:MAG: hypothetical protein AAF430_20685 [Myxococcota bacterium]
MDDAAGERIEKLLEKLVAQQSELSLRIARLESEGDDASVEESRAGRERVLRFLDEFRAGEALGELSLGAWIAVCTDPRLRGELRTVAAREGSHARLLRERMRELGGAPRYEVPEDTYAQVLASSSSTERSDAEKVRDFTRRFPDPDAALAPILRFADSLGDDPETQSLLRSIAQDERATLELFYAAEARFAGGEGG